MLQSHLWLVDKVRTCSLGITRFISRGPASGRSGISYDDDNDDDDDDAFTLPQFVVLRSIALFSGRLLNSI